MTLLSVFITSMNIHRVSHLQVYLLITCNGGIIGLERERERERAQFIVNVKLMRVNVNGNMFFF